MKLVQGNLLFITILVFFVASFTTVEAYKHNVVVEKRPGGTRRRRRLPKGKKSPQATPPSGDESDPLPSGEESQDSGNAGGLGNNSTDNDPPSDGTGDNTDPASPDDQKGGSADGDCPYVAGPGCWGVRACMIIEGEKVNKCMLTKEYSKSGATCGCCDGVCPEHWTA